ncbi:hypothetical protein C2I38_25345 [Ralstonia solanacearum]|nr:hypothetical protein C2I38_25345 [Ralstonia solanacearum]
MKQPEDLIVGRIYFDIYFEDPDLRYPMIHSYEYSGVSDYRAGSYEFRILGSDEILLIKEEELEDIVDVEGLAVQLKEWARQNPDLSS